MAKKSDSPEFTAYLKKCWDLHMDRYPERELDMVEFRKMGLLKWNDALEEKKQKFFVEGPSDEMVEPSSMECNSPDLSACFVNFSRQMRKKVIEMILSSVKASAFLALEFRVFGSPL